MNRAVYLNTLERLFTSKPRMALAAVMFLLPLTMVLAARGGGQAADSSAGILAVILGTGIVGREISNGSLMAILARPVRRSEVVLTKWAALGTAATLLALAQILLAYLIAATYSSSVGPPPAGLFLGLVTEGFGTAAVMVAFSTMTRGFGDLGIYFLVSIVSVMAAVLGGIVHRPAFTVAGRELGYVIAPKVALPLHGVWTGGYTAAAYLSTVTAALAVAVILLNRKELSYADD